MGLVQSLKNMSVEEKILAMELLWDDLCRDGDILPSPQWHRGVLEEREGLLERGEDAYMDWEEAKKSIREELS
ncbi:addiction module protein [Desulfobotulus mexicanus]|uniref:Addiction module protein n=1 Tax=Desulfobotulus mexicanus TaxID=2586642 RepID=A0A5Q4VBM4_9BACT|nr:addiction module protein [Desulfobotulus mexicanus]TYT74955.1 addiction module protein [Desulfobotulus mexicanus]